jgi:AcrR family transcriptional regulator
MDSANQTAVKKRTRRGDSRALLLAATSKILSERNTIDVSLSDIAEVSGLNSALIKYHFGNKEGLLLALVKRDAETSMIQMNKLLTMPVSPEQKIRLHISGIISTYAKYPYLNRLIHALIDNPDKKLARHIATFFVQPLVEAQGKILSEGQDLGVFQIVDPMHFYYSIVGACDILFYARHTLDIVFGISQLTPEIREAYSAKIAENALLSLRKIA